MLFTFAFNMEGLFDYSLWGLFLASFLAATVRAVQFGSCAYGGFG